MSPALPKLIDCAGIQRELGVTRSAAEALMRQVPKVRPAGLRKVYVRRQDLERLLSDSTRAA